MNHWRRRDFLGASGGVLIGGAGARLMGANDRVNVAIVGLGGRGSDHIDSFASLPGARIAALCDVNQAARERAVARVRKLNGSEPKTYADLRQVLEDKDVDAVSLATPNHWHALGTIWACQAGKDVYTEKPASYNIVEGRVMVEAARKHGRMVQVGTQNRSAPHVQRAIELVRQGAIGKIHLAKGFCYKRRPSIGHKPDAPVPPGLDWDMFLGPAPMRAFNELRFKYNWHWFWDTGNGDIGNQGAHEMDIARWGLNRQGWPKSIVCTGGKLLYEDDQETPNMQSAVFDYGDAQLVFEVRGLITGGDEALKSDGQNTVGAIFYGSEGYLGVNSNGFRLFHGEKRELAKEESAGDADNGTAVHMDNFLKAVRSRKFSDLNADIQTGADSAALCHLANVSYRVRRKLDLDSSGNVTNDGEASALYTRSYRSPYVLPTQV